MLRELFKARVGNVALPEIQHVRDYILKTIVPPTDVIKGVLHLEGKMLLGGGSKSFKTWQQLDVSLSVATG